MRNGIVKTYSPAGVNIHTIMLTTIATSHLILIWFLRMNKKIRTLWKSESYTHINSDNQRCWSFIQHLWFSKIMCCVERQSSLSAVVSVDISYSQIGRTWRYDVSLEKCHQFFAIKDFFINTFKLNWFKYNKKIFFVKFFSTFFYKKNFIQNFQFWIDIFKMWKSSCFDFFEKYYIFTVEKLHTNRIILFKQSWIVQMIIVKRDFWVCVSHQSRCCLLW